VDEESAVGISGDWGDGRRGTDAGGTASGMRSVRGTSGGPAGLWPGVAISGVGAVARSAGWREGRETIGVLLFCFVFCVWVAFPFVGLHHYLALCFSCR
jgi:hypothetical protein